jgi:hypothetical protein
VSNIIDFLERLGQDAELRLATSGELEEALKGAGIEPALRSAILGKNQQLLEILLGASSNVCCLVHSPDEQEEEEEGEEEEDDEAEEEEEEMKPKSHVHAVGSVA